MKRIVKVLPPDAVITVNQLRSSDHAPVIAAYRSANSEAYCVLSQVSKDGYRAAFIPLNGAQKPRYFGENVYDAIEKASASRSVFLFSSMEEMLKAMVNKSF